MDCRAKGRAHAPLPTAPRKDEPRRAQHVERNAPRQALVKAGALLNRNVARQAQVQQLLHWKLPAPLGHRDDDAVDAFALNDVAQFVRQTDDARVDEALADEFGTVVNEADDAVSGVAPLKNLARHLDRRRAGADNENPLSDVGVSQKPVRADAPGDHQQERHRQRYQRDAAPYNQRRHEVHHNRQRDPREAERLYETQDELASVVHDDEVV